MVTEIQHLLKNWRKVSITFMGALWLSITLDQRYSKSALWTSRMRIPWNSLEMQILKPLPDPLNWKCWGEASHLG